MQASLSVSLTSKHHNLRSTITGGFVAGHGGNTTVIRGEGVYALLAHGIQSEPGPRSRAFDFDARSLGNTIVSHDNDAMAGRTLDRTFSQLTSGGLFAGDFSDTAATYSGVGLDYRLGLQIEATGYVKQLETQSLACRDPRKPLQKKDLCAAAGEAEGEVARLRRVVAEQGARIDRLEGLLERLL